MTKYKILEMLRNNGNNFISGEFISRELQVSRTAVWKGINSLKEKGYKIEGINNKGYRLIQDSGDVISEYEIKKMLTGKELGNHIYCFEKINSTNTYAKQNADVLEHGDVIIADEQLKGRGRMEKVFYSPKESGIYMTVVFKKNIFYDSIKLLSIAAFVSVHRAIEKCTGFSPDLSWNDINIKGKKICGILTECSIEGETGRVEQTIVGIGVNVNNSEFPRGMKNKTTSLRSALRKELNRKEIIAAILNEMENLICCKKYISNRKNILNEYMAKTRLLDKFVEIKLPEKKILGKVIGINSLGGLIIIKENGKKEIIYTGELKGAEN